MTALNTGELSWVKQINILGADGVCDALKPRVILVPSASFCDSLSVKWLQAARDYLASALQRPEVPGNIYCLGAAFDQCWRRQRINNPAPLSSDWDNSGVTHAVSPVTLTLTSSHCWILTPCLTSFSSLFHTLKPLLFFVFLEIFPNKPLSCESLHHGLLLGSPTYDNIVIELQHMCSLMSTSLWPHGL